MGGSHPLLRLSESYRSQNIRHWSCKPKDEFFPVAMTIHLIFPILVSSSLMSFILQRRHLLIALLALERTTLITMIFAATIFGAPSQFNIIIILVIITLAACEARLGLALIVIITRSYGSDTIKLLSINKC